ncbi:hypothetical protein N7478_009558 [Penicillium angulare]|uniref:uncharacterized protein n=1 Tax=Penicillium angulare TaxID=116970 RepID=UPI0025422B1A|nr:uncharacterized protein N7478_009558 [Penicillium angulare]KAJ5266750.1 hypothetical protein N7478_009558 [Penicillium angulare]
MSQLQLDNPNGRALTWIFDHCLRYPSSYEIPLRTMYTINCNPAKGTNANRTPETAFSPRDSISTTSTKSNKSSHSEDSIDAAADFRSQLIHQISRLPSQPCSLPPAFLCSFLRRCFTEHLESVDFPQALTALDYLKDLECRWKKEIANAVQRLNIDREDAQDPLHSELGMKYPGVMAWLQNMNAKARTLEALYTQVYVGLRRWTLINDMLLEPQGKANHIAMLNTLFPPVTDKTPTPTPQLTLRILKSHRDGFFRYINAVSTHGTGVLDSFISAGAPEGHSSTWPLLYESLEKYLNLAMEMIEECTYVNEPANLENAGPNRSKTRKADSGISFGSSTTDTSGADSEKPLPHFPIPSPTQTKATGLERLVGELRRIGFNNKSKNLKKMKSTTALNTRPSSQDSYAESSFFEIDEQKRRRLIGEATKRKTPQASQAQ